MKLDKKGSVPIPYIIALILGVVIIALLGYWLFFIGGQFGGVVSEKACEGKKMAYCSEYKTTGSVSGDKDFSKECPITDKSAYYAPECCRFSWAWGKWDICD